MSFFSIVDYGSYQVVVHTSATKVRDLYSFTHIFKNIYVKYSLQLDMCCNAQGMLNT
jgi:ribosomal silencing factor RsfS